MAGKFSINATFRAIDKITAPLNKMMGSSQKFSKSIKKDFAKAQRQVDRLGRSIKQNLGRVLRTGLTAGLIAVTAGLGMATAEFIEFDKSIVNATAKFKDLVPGSEAASKSMEEMRKVARKVGSDTQFSATEAGQGLDFLAMAGFNSKQAMALLPGVVDLATVAGVDLARSTDIASDALGAFGLMSEDTGVLSGNLTRVMDVMAKTITSTNTDMEMLFETMKFAGPAFTSGGQSLETFSAIAGRMAANGIKASMAGTAMRSAMLRLQDPTPKAAAGLDMFGLSLEKITKDGKLMDMVDIMQLMEDGSKRLTTVQRNAALSAIVGKNAFSGWAAVMNEGVAQTRLLQEQLLRAKGAASEMAAFMRSSLSVRLQILKSSLIELGFKFIEAFQEKGSSALESFTKAVQTFDPTPVIEGVKTFVNVISTMWSIVKPLLPFVVSLVVVFKAYAAIMGIVALAQLSLNTAMGASPIGMILISVGLLIGLFIKLRDWTGSALNAILALSAAMIALNVAMAANPIGLVITAVAGLIAGIIKLYTLLSNPPGTDETGKSFITRSARRTAAANEDIRSMSGMPDILPTLTQRESVTRSISENNSTSRVILENQSDGTLSSNGKKTGRGQSLILPRSG